MHGAVFVYRQLIFAAWMIWLGVWAVSAMWVKRTARSEALHSRLAYILPLVLGAWLIAIPRLPLGPLSLQLWPSGPARYLCALILVVLGLGFSLWARVHLGRNWSGTVTVKEQHQLIRSGPYAYVRHPIYTGLMIALAGSAVACGEARALIGLAIIVYSFVRKLRIEEVFMREMFPAQYEHYSSQVPALVPFTAARRSAPR